MQDYSCNVKLSTNRLCRIADLVDYFAERLLGDVAGVGGGSSACTGGGGGGAGAVVVASPMRTRFVLQLSCKRVAKL